jgi:site-specific recombinase XerD
MQVWAEAFEMWLESRRTENTRRAYRAAWQDFTEFSMGKNPWMVGKKDIAEWTESLHKRKLADTTIGLRLAAISSFYEYVSSDYTVVDGAGNEIPLHTHNPASAKSLRPKVVPYGKATYLSAKEAKALLKAIKRNSAQGLRDYALFLTYLSTGRRNTEVRNLKWGDFQQVGDTMMYRWSGKGKEDEKFEMPKEAWKAILAYLKAAERLDSIQEQDYIFTALSDRAKRLKNIDAETWDPTAQPLSMREVGRLLKHYCKKAGLDPKKVHVHTLRHSAAMLRKEAGDSMEDISAFLAHSGIAVTQIYVHRVEGQKDKSWRKVAAILGLEE